MATKHIRGENSAELTAAEFFLLYDCREERWLRAGLKNKQFDPDKAETETVKRQRLQTLKTFRRPSEWSDDMGPTDGLLCQPMAWDHPKFDRNSNHYHSRFAFKTKKPANLSRWFDVLDYAHIGGCYRIASLEWAKAIKGAEPASNQFFPVTLEFIDDVIDGYKIIYEAKFPLVSDMPHYADPIDPKNTATYWLDALKRAPMLPATQNHRLVGRRDMLQHIGWRARWSYRYASRIVAQQLNKLILPAERKYFYFIPIALGDN